MEGVLYMCTHTNRRKKNIKLNFPNKFTTIYVRALCWIVPFCLFKSYFLFFSLARVCLVCSQKLYLQHHTLAAILFLPPAEWRGDCVLPSREKMRCSVFSLTHSFIHSHPRTLEHTHTLSGISFNRMKNVSVFNKHNDFINPLSDNGVTPIVFDKREIWFWPVVVVSHVCVCVCVC